MTTTIDVADLREWMQRAHDQDGFSFCCETAEENGLTYETIEALLDIVEAAREYRREMADIAQAWREDWSDFDGRTLRNQEADASTQLVALLAVSVPARDNQ